MLDDDSLTNVLLEPQQEVTKLNTRPQDGESTRGKISHHNVTRSGVRKSQEPRAVPVSVTTGQHPDTRTHGHMDTRTHGHTDTRTHRHTDTQTHRHTDTQTHRHTDTQTQRHRDTETQRHRQRCTCVGWSTNRDNEIAQIIINYFRRRISH